MNDQEFEDVITFFESLQKKGCDYWPPKEIAEKLKEYRSKSPQVQP